MWMRLQAKNVFAAALFQLGILVVVNGPQTTTTNAAPEPRGPRFGAKPHPGRVEHIHPGAHGEIVYHHDPRVIQGINGDEFKLASNSIDASGYWESGRFGGGAGALAADKGSSVAAAANSGYYEGISKPKYEYRKALGYKNVNGAHRGVSANLCGVFGFALATMFLTLRS